MFLPPKILILENLDLDDVKMLCKENAGVIFSFEGDTVCRQQKTKMEPFFALRRAHGRVIDSDDDEFDLVYRL